MDQSLRGRRVTVSVRSASPGLETVSLRGHIVRGVEKVGSWIGLVGLLEWGVPEEAWGLKHSAGERLG